MVLAAHFNGHYAEIRDYLLSVTHQLESEEPHAPQGRRTILQREYEGAKGLVTLLDGAIESGQQVPIRSAAGSSDTQQSRAPDPASPARSRGAAAPGGPPLGQKASRMNQFLYTMAWAWVFGFFFGWFW